LSKKHFYVRKIRGEVDFLSPEEAKFHETMKKMFTSSVNNCPETCCAKGWGRAEKASKSHPHPISQLVRGYSLKDDLTVTFFLGDSFMLNLLSPNL
jgi:hypothetical protein